MKKNMKEKQKNIEKQPILSTKQKKEIAEQLINKNKLNITLRDPEYQMHIISIHSLIEEKYDKAYELAKMAYEKYTSRIPLWIG